jgi:hypothetical protein
MKKAKPETGNLKPESGKTFTAETQRRQGAKLFLTTKYTNHTNDKLETGNLATDEHR